MTLGDNSIVSIVEIAVYLPTILVSLFICLRHGFGRSSGWYYTLALALIRVVGASCQLATESNPGDRGLIIAAVLLENLGLTPLLLATLGILSRLIEGISHHKTRSPPVTVKHLRIIQLVIAVGAVLAIVGATKANTLDPNSPATTESQIAVVLYAVAFAAVALVLLLLAPSAPLLPEAERVIIPAVALALPLLAVRVLYALLRVFVHSGVFGRTTAGSVGVRVGMSVVEEFVVVAIYLFLGFRLPRLRLDKSGCDGETLPESRVGMPRFDSSGQDPEQGTQHRR